MAIIQKLRTKYAKLTGAIIVVAMLGFIFMDLGRKGGSSPTTIGKIEGKEIEASEYQAQITEQEHRYQQQSNGQTLSADQHAQMRDQVWQQIVTEQILANMNEKLGIKVTQAEMDNYLTGPNPGPLVKQFFTNQQTGKFNPQEVSVRLQQMKNDPNQKPGLDAFLLEVKKRHFDQKAAVMLAGALYVPKFVLDNEIKGMKETATAKVVKIPFSTVSDSKAKVTDKDITEYIKEHKNQFEVPKATRNIEFIPFPVLPSAEDSAKVLTYLDTLKAPFATTTDIEAFVNHNSQDATPPQYYTEKQLKSLPNAQELMNAPLNEVIGPFYDGKSYEIARVLEKKLLPDSSTSRHIMVFISQGDKQIRTDSSAKERIDSAIAFLKSGVPFDSVSARYSEDKYSVEAGSKGQDFSLFQREQLSNAFGKDFTNFIFEGKAGEAKLIKVDSNTNYKAYNYVQILHQTALVPSIKMALVSRELDAGDETGKKIFNRASSLTAEIARSEGKKTFDQVATENNIQTKSATGIDQNSFMINGLGSTEDLVKWIYDEDTKIGDISPVFNVNGSFIIAKLTGTQPKGLLQLDDQNRDMLRAMVLKDKKSKMLLDKYKDKPASLEEIAQKSQQPIINLDSLTFTEQFVPGLGNEPKVIGYAFNPDFKVNTVSPAIAGQEGVYFLSVIQRSEKALPPQLNLQAMKTRMVMTIRQSAPQAIIKSMIENADVKDMRSDIY